MRYVYALYAEALMAAGFSVEDTKASVVDFALEDGALRCGVCPSCGQRMSVQGGGDFWRYRCACGKVVLRIVAPVTAVWS